ncbi:hypothetical protein BDW62DRAFT_34115 [Aspergillus aurantiobrunneus]
MSDTYVATDACFSMHWSNIIYNSDDQPCGPLNETNPVVPCCLHGHQCLTNSICMNPEAEEGLQYYSADCTDKTLQDPACGNRCGGKTDSHVTFLSNPDRWACCTLYPENNTVSCDDPTDEVWPGPAPSLLQTIATIPATGNPTYTLAPATAIATAEPQSTSSNGISAGAAAGIGVGVGAGVAVICFAAGYLWLRRKGHLESASNASPYDKARAHPESPQPILEAGVQPVYELGRPEDINELDSRTTNNPRPR